MRSSGESSSQRSGWLVGSPGQAPERQQLGGEVQHQGGLADLVGPGDEERVAELPGVRGRCGARRRRRDCRGGRRAPPGQCTRRAAGISPRMSGGEPGPRGPPQWPRCPRDRSAGPPPPGRLPDRARRGPGPGWCPGTGPTWPSSSPSSSSASRCCRGSSSTPAVERFGARPGPRPEPPAADRARELRRADRRLRAGDDHRRRLRARPAPRPAGGPRMADAPAPLAPGRGGGERRRAGRADLAAERRGRPGPRPERPDRDRAERVRPRRSASPWCCSRWWPRSPRRHSSAASSTAGCAGASTCRRRRSSPAASSPPPTSAGG